MAVHKLITQTDAFTVAIAGNPNAGKTALFNAITGSRQHVGNWPGVTVEKKEGRVNHKGRFLHIVDLPGAYSLSSQAIDETIARDFLTTQHPDAVINVVDATNLERNLYLTIQLLELRVPLVVALNMFDEAQALGFEIDVDALSEALGVPVIATVAIAGEGVEALLDAAAEVARQQRPTVRKAMSNGLPEADDATTSRRYDKAADIAKAVIKNAPDSTEFSPSQRIDRILLNPWLSFPVFFGVIFLIFQFTFTLSEPIAELFVVALESLGAWIGSLLPEGIISAFLTDAVLGGLGAVLEFVPPIFLLFFAISLLEDIGYMSRAALISDGFMKRVGLHGRAFIPMILGFGCNVTGIMAARCLDSPRDRLISILVNPLISCSARLPVYVLFATAFFDKRRGLVVFSLYALGVVLALVVAKILSIVLKPDGSSAFVMELPPYRMPKMSVVLLQTWERGRDFLHKAGTIILLGVIVVWAMSSLPYGVEPGSPDSLLARIGRLIAPVLRPAGFGTWQAATALLFGIVAKEMVVGTLGVLYGAGEATLVGAVQAHWTPLAAYAFLVMTLIYIPCIATIGAIRQETRSRTWTAIAVGYLLLLGWIMAVGVYQIGSLLGFA
ncbi:MAG: ferrous iron transport protein B [Limnochordia bacterium]|jgi:ferrous iron transport protein B